MDAKKENLYSRYGKFPLYILFGSALRKLLETIIELFTLPKLERQFRALPFAQHAMQKLLSDYEFDTILDVGSGEGTHAEFLAKHGKLVTALDYGDSLYFNNRNEFPKSSFNLIVADFNEYNFESQFDAIWCSHVLEHQPNVNIFLQKVFAVLKNDGVLAITIPPSRNCISGGHLTNWNGGLLLYNLVLAGFDCRHAILLKYGYNISVIVRKKKAVFNSLVFDSGDIRVIQECLPNVGFFSSGNDVSFNGNLFKIRW